MSATSCFFTGISSQIPWGSLGKFLCQSFHTFPFINFLHISNRLFSLPTMCPVKQKGVALKNGFPFWASRCLPGRTQFQSSRTVLLSALSPVFRTCYICGKVSVTKNIEQVQKAYTTYWFSTHVRAPCPRSGEGALPPFLRSENMGMCCLWVTATWVSGF